MEFPDNVFKELNELMTKLKSFDEINKLDKFVNHQKN